MDPIKGVLDEQFFLVASDACMEALKDLVDDSIAKYLSHYLDCVDVDNPAAVRIQKDLGENIRSATFHLHIKDQAYDQVVAKITPEIVANLTMGYAQILDVLEYLDREYSHIRNRIEPNSSEAFAKFVALCPGEYQTLLLRNKELFVQPRAKARPTGVGIILRTRSQWEIALKGLRYRIHCEAKGIPTSTYLAKEF